MQTSPTRVLAIFRHFYPVLAGASERFRRYFPGLRQRGIDFQVVTTTVEAHEPPPLNVACPLLHRVEVTGERRIDLDRRLLQEARRLIRSPEFHGAAPVIQLISGYPALAPQLIRLRRSGARTLFVGTMVEPSRSPDSWAGQVKRVIRQRLLAASFDFFVASSGVMAEEMIASGAPRKRTSIISNGVDVDRFRPLSDDQEKQSLRDRLGLPPSAPVVLFVGNIMPRKGVDLLVEAWQGVHRVFPEAVLLLLGPLERPTLTLTAEREELRAYQQRLFANCGSLLGDRIRFPGESQEVDAYLRAADVFVFPSRKEGLGNVVLEAMASGVPMVLTDYLGRPRSELGVPGTHFDLSDFSPQQLAGHILGLLRSPERRRDMGEAAHRWARQYHSLSGTLDSYAALYQALSQGSRFEAIAGCK